MQQQMLLLCLTLLVVTNCTNADDLPVMSDPMCLPPNPVKHLTSRETATDVHVTWRNPHGATAEDNLNFTVTVSDTVTGEKITNDHRIYDVHRTRFRTVVGGLVVPCRMYTVHVVASSTCGTSLVASINVHALPKSDPPSHFKLSTKENTTAIEVTFTAPTQKSAGECELKYQVKYKEDLRRGGYGFTEVKEIWDASKQPILLTNLKPETYYVCNVVAIAYRGTYENSYSTADNDIETEKGVVPNAVENIEYKILNNIVSVKWDPPKHNELNPVVEYKIQSCDNDIIYTSIREQVYVQVMGTQCEYTVTAINSAGNGPAASVSVTIPIPNHI